MFVYSTCAPHTSAHTFHKDVYAQKNPTPYKSNYPTNMHKDMLVHTDIFVGISQLLGYDNLIQSLTLELF